MCSRPCGTAPRSRRGRLLREAVAPSAARRRPVVFRRSVIINGATLAPRSQGPDSQVACVRPAGATSPGQARRLMIISSVAQCLVTSLGARAIAHGDRRAWAAPKPPPRSPRQPSESQPNAGGQHPLRTVASGFILSDGRNKSLTPVCSQGRLGHQGPLRRGRVARRG